MKNFLDLLRKFIATFYKIINAVFAKAPEKIIIVNEVNNQVFGLNTGLSFYHAKKNPPALYNEIEQYTKKICSPLLRFSGGTIACFYHPNKPGYGLNQSETDTYKNNLSSHIMDDINYPFNENVIEVFIDMVKATGAEVTYVVNLFTGDYISETRGVIQAFLNAGITLCIELGNEHYHDMYKTELNNVPVNEFPDVQAYINLAKVTADQIRADFPQIKKNRNCGCSSFHGPRTYTKSNPQESNMEHRNCKREFL